MACFGLVRRPTRRCAACSPINQNHEADVLRVTGFLGSKKSTKPIPGGLYLGVELEVECREDADPTEPAQQAKTLLDPKRVILKHDGSLRNGFEIVSGPAPLWFHQKELWGPFFEWQAKEKALLSHNAPSGTCGLHVHVSRAPLTQLQIGKMVQFLHAPENNAFVRYMAGRPSSSRYADYLAPKRVRPILGQNGKPLKRGGPKQKPAFRVREEAGVNVLGRAARYTALNLQNEATVEFRLFRGTLNPGTFFARLEFCHALVKYSAPSVSGLCDTTADKFTKWLMVDRRKVYPNLVNYLDDGRFVNLPERPAERLR